MVGRPFARAEPTIHYSVARSVEAGKTHWINQLVARRWTLTLGARSYTSYTAFVVMQ